MSGPGAVCLARNRVQVMGAGPDCLVLVPGFGTDQAAWRHVVAAYGDSHRIVLLDLVGLGPDNGAHYDHLRYRNLGAYAADLLDVVRAAAPEGCVCVGHSVGGMVALLAAIEAPDCIRRLVTLNASPCYLNLPGYRGGFEERDLRDLFSAAVADYLHWSRSFGARVVGQPPGDPVLREFVRNLQAMRPDIALSILTTIFHLDLRARLPEVTVPTLILQARHDPAVTREAADHLRDRIPHSTLEILDAAGHLPHLTAPDTVIRALRRWV